MHEIDLPKAIRETIRWRILCVLNVGRPSRVAETLIFRALHDAELHPTPSEVRRELDYLRDKGLAEVTGEDGPSWSAVLTAQGVDVVEYTVACPDGVGRPKKWY